MKNNKQRVMGALSRAKDTVIDKTSDVLSAGHRAYYKNKSDKANVAYENYRMANQTPKSVPDGGPKGEKSSKLFMARNALLLAQDKK